MKLLLVIVAVAAVFYGSVNATESGCTEDECLAGSFAADTSSSTDSQAGFNGSLLLARGGVGVKPTIEDRKEALAQEYRELDKIRMQLEKEREGLSTPEGVAAYKEKLKAFNQRVVVYEKERKDIAAAEETAGSTISATDATAAVESEEIESADSKVGEDVSEEAAPEDIKAKQAEQLQAFRAEKEVLDKTRETLEAEREALMKEKASLESRVKPRMLRPDAEALKKEQQALMKKIDEFDKKMEAYEADVKGYNTRLEKAGLAGSGS
jgi:chromosome segregation ATPase